MTFVTRKNLAIALVLTVLTASAVSTAVDRAPIPTVFQPEKEHALIFHVYRSAGLNWASPRTISRTTIRASLKSKKPPFPIGHMTVEVRCGDVSVKSGMTQRFRDEDNRVVRKEKQGLGVLFHTFVGKHEDTEKVNKDLNILMNSGRLAVLKFRISPESCNRMMEFQRNYVAQEMFQNYGFLSRPLEGEGGGCSAYAMAYPEVGGLLEPWMVQQWSRYLKVPQFSVGGPLTGYRIGLRKTYMNGAHRWATEDEAGFPLFFYDPDRVFNWIQTVYEGRPTDDGTAFTGAIRRIPVTRELLGIPVTPQIPVMALELDRTSALPPAKRNFRLEQRNPLRASYGNSSFLGTHWGEKMAFQKDYLSRTRGIDPVDSQSDDTDMDDLQISDEQIEMIRQFQQPDGAPEGTGDWSRPTSF